MILCAKQKERECQTRSKKQSELLLLCLLYTYAYFFLPFSTMISVQLFGSAAKLLLPGYAVDLGKHLQRQILLLISLQLLNGPQTLHCTLTDKISQTKSFIKSKSVFFFFYQHSTLCYKRALLFLTMYLNTHASLLLLGKFCKLEQKHVTKCSKLSKYKQNLLDTTEVQ